MQILQSELVRVRRARWRVANVRAYERCHLLTLRGVERANARVERLILAPFDTVDRLEPRSRPRRVSIRVWRRACRALIATETPPGGLRAARLARIDLLPHQLEPALALLRGRGSRVLLADAVGLGKTIQAGLIVAELRALGAADRVLVLTPAGLRDQWARELADRFDLDATVLDARTVRQAVATLPVGVNPWGMTPIAITSIDYVKRPDILTSLAACRWDILIVDEAHGVAGDSDRHAAVAALAARAPFVVLLTATPHSGDRRAFTSLCGLGALPAAADGDPLLVFRRTRADVRIGTARRVHRLLVRPSAAEARMHALLARFSRAVEREHGPAIQGSRANLTNTAEPDISAHTGVWLALSVLHKRALSSASSLLRSVERRLATLTSTRDSGEDQPLLPLFDPAGEFTPADLPPAWPSALAFRDPADERQMLGELAEAAAAAARHESKIGALRRLLRRLNEPAIVFTEYRDTLVHVQASLAVQTSLLHGGMTRDERLSAIDEFTRGARRVLLATDAAGEGLNLQRPCRSVINLELPWNPMRLEQRIGRVDRIGQTKTVHAFHLIARDSAEPRILARLEARMARARADIGAPDPLGLDGSADEEEEEVGRGLDHRSWGPTPTRWRLAPSGSTPAAGASDPALTLVATSEAERIGRARALLRAGDENALVHLDGRGPCIAVTHRWKIRAALGRRLLVLYRTGVAIDASDADGVPRVAGSLLVPLAIELAHDAAVASAFRRTSRLNADTALDSVRRLDADIRHQVDEATLSWRERVSEIHRAFLDTRLHRERAISAAHSVPPPIFQPGLFDRRNERARLALFAGGRDRDLDRAALVALLEGAAALSPTSPELLLILVPA